MRTGEAESDVLSEIDSLITRGKKAIPRKSRRKKLKLYAEGLKAKLRQVDFALAQLSQYQEQADGLTERTGSRAFSVTDQIQFYCDAFWTFLYSSLDVLAQVINQALELGLNEQEVSFKKIEGHLRSKEKGNRLQVLVTKCRNSRPYRNLDNYRNCSIHRRQIYIEEELRIVRHTPGYESATTTGPTVSVERLLCKDPLSLTPEPDRRRKIPDYLEETREKIRNAIEDIVRAILPTK